jgi:hypothetical protein
MMDGQDNKPRISISVGGDNSGNILVDNMIVLSRLEEAGLEAVSDPKTNARTLRLYRVLSDGFNREEIANLAFEIGIDIEDFSSRSKTSQARELVEFMGRRNRLPELEAHVRRLRPALFDDSDSL